MFVRRSLQVTLLRACTRTRVPSRLLSGEVPHQSTQVKTDFSSEPIPNTTVHAPSTAIPNLNSTPINLSSIIPEPVSGWPTPWITEDHFNTYINGLYERGWGIHFSNANSKFIKPIPVSSKGKARSTPERPENVICRVPELLRTYNFTERDVALSFVHDLTSLMETEKHHCALHITDRGNPQVTVYVHTHTASPPKWEDVPLEDSKAPGITLRDIRFAILVDKLHDDSYIAKDRGTSSTRRTQSQTPPWSKYESRLKANLLAPENQRSTSDHNSLGYYDHVLTYSSSSQLKKPKSSKLKPIKDRRSANCPACSRPHPLELCPSRQSFPPPKPCVRCGGNHWKLDCPSKDVKRRKPSSLRPPPDVVCKLCGGNHYVSDCHIREDPPVPCINCGGNHWKMDCRMPQVSPERAMALRLPIP